MKKKFKTPLDIMCHKVDYTGTPEGNCKYKGLGNAHTHGLGDYGKMDLCLGVDLDLEESSENIVPNPNIELDIVFEDDSILIVNKSAGIPVHPSMNHFTDSLSNAVKYYFNTINLKKKIRPVNRLDKNTSGLVIFAKKVVHNFFC